MTNITENNEEIITLEQAQELISEKQTNIMQQADEFTNHIIELQQQDSQNLVTEDEKNSADELLDSLEE